MQRVVVVDTAKLPADMRRYLTYCNELERLHQGFNRAANEIEKSTGCGICMPNCGLCCTQNSVVTLGIEAEYAYSWLLGRPSLIPKVLDACREWLTRPGRWTVSRSISTGLWQSLEPEYLATLTGQCPFLEPDKTCMVHYARPLVCRAFGVTHMPGQNCPRPLGHGEHPNGRAIWDDSHPAIPLKPMTHRFARNIIERRYSRQGFFYTMLFERFRASELAGLVDDGKVPAVKLAVGWGGGNMLLWQKQLDQIWSNEEADAAIETQAPLTEIGGQLVTSVDFGRLTPLRR